MNTCSARMHATSQHARGGCIIASPYFTLAKQLVSRCMHMVETGRLLSLSNIQAADACLAVSSMPRESCQCLILTHISLVVAMKKQS